jgi:PAS domain S-box-containing protein
MPETPTQIQEMLRRQNEYLAALHDTTLDLINRHDLQELLEALVRRAGQLLGTPHGFIYLVLPGEAEMERQVGVGVFNVNRAPRLKPGEGLSGKVWQSGQPIVVNDYDNWPGRSAVGVALVDAMVGIPLRSGARVTGVLALGSERGSGRTFGDEEVEVLTRFGQLASLALDNARLFETTQQNLQELAIVNRVSQALASHLELNALIELVGEQLREVFRAPYIFIALHNKETDRIHFPYFWDYDHREYSEEELTLGQGLTSRIIETKQPQLINSDWKRRAAELGAVYEGEPVTCSLGVPILVGDDAIGVIMLQHIDGENLFTDSDVRLLATLAGNIGAAIHNARLFQQANRRADETAALLEISREISATLDLPTVLERIAKRACDVLKARDVVLRLLEPDGSLPAVVAIGKYADVFRNFPVRLGFGLMGRVGQTGVAEIINYPASDPRVAHVAGTEDDESTEAIILAPMMIRETVIGVMGLWRDRAVSGLFTEADLDFLVGLARQAAIAIQNARLFAEVQRRKQYYEAMLANSPVAIVTIDPEARVTSWNPAAESLFGYTLDEALGRNVDDLIARDENLKLEAASYSQQALNQNVQVLTQRTRKDGTRVEVELLGVPVTVGEEQAGVIAIYHDVTELQRARREAEAANQVKSAFLNSVSHELRTPLTSVLGFTKIIQKRLDEVVFPGVQAKDRKVQRAIEQVRDNLNIIANEGERLTAMVNEVLDLGKIEAGEVEWRREPVAMEDVIGRATAATSALFVQKKLALMKEVEPGLPPVVGDRDRLLQVMINLLSNAVKFTEQGSVTCRARREDSALVISVIDTGLGIALEDQQQVFEKFKQVSGALTDKPQGTGLGLSICKEIVEHHGGRIWVESAGVPGRGSAFSFTLPL